MLRTICLAGCIVAATCSPVMEATRPDPVNLQQFAPGERRIDVLAEVGGPIASTPDGPDTCDIYKLYTRGPGGAGKGAIAAGEVVGDVLTLGLSEVLFTPVEAATRNSKHNVLFCYGADGKLVSARESETHVD
jgi:hypothetical protein